MKKTLIILSVIVIFSLLFALIIQVQAATLEPCPYYEKWNRGDADADGIMDITDAVFMLNWLFRGGTSPKCLEYADVNNDGTVDITDAVNLLDWLFQGGSSPPSPSSWELADYPIILEFLHVSPPIDEPPTVPFIYQGEEIPETTARIPYTFALTTKTGKVKDCRVVAHPIDQAGNVIKATEILIIDTEWDLDPNFKGTDLSIPFEFAIESQEPEHHKLIPGDYLFDVTCEGMLNEFDTAYLKVNVVSDWPAEQVGELHVCTSNDICCINQETESTSMHL